jgi:hypothetical protein
MSYEAEIQRGKRAQEVIENEVYTEAHASIEAEIIRLWREAKNTDDREQLHMLLGLHGQVRTALESVMRSGEIAAAELARKMSRAEQMARFSVRAA